MSNTPRVSHIIFDWSGTLQDDFKISYLSTRETILRFGGKDLSLDEYKNQFCLPAWKFYRKRGLKASMDEIDESYFRSFGKAMALYRRKKKLKLFKGVLPLLKEIKKQGLGMILYSTVDEGLLRARVEEEGLLPYFKTIVGSVRDKELGLKGLVERMKLNGKRTLYVGDMDHDVHGAKKAGVMSGALLCGYHSSAKLLAASPDFVWNDHGGLLQFLKRQTKKPQKPALAERPVPTVGALIENRGEIFLVQTHKWGYTFGIPGGKIELGEPSVEALKREIREETGLKIHDIVFARVFDSIFSKEFYKKNQHFLLLNYFAKSASRKFKLNDEADTGLWINPVFALKLRLNDPTRALITYFLRCRKMT